MILAQDERWPVSYTHLDVYKRQIGCCMAFRKELLKTVLPFPQKIPMHDQFIGLMAQKKGNVELIARPLIDYRRHGKNVSGDHHGSFGTMLSQRISMVCAVLSRH